MVLAILVLVTAGGLALALRDRAPGGGPLSAGTGGFSYTHRLGVGEIFSLGHVLFTNGARKPAVIERVRLLGVTDGLELLGMRTRPVPDQEGKGMFLGANGFPPPEWPSQPFAQANQVPVPREFNEKGDPIEGLELVIVCGPHGQAWPVSGPWSSPTRSAGAATGRSGGVDLPLRSRRDVYARHLPRSGQG